MGPLRFKIFNKKKEREINFKMNERDDPERFSPN